MLAAMRGESEVTAALVCDAERAAVPLGLRSGPLLKSMWGGLRALREASKKRGPGVTT